MIKENKIVVIGTGYVGLPAALMLAKAGQKVVGVDINKNIVKAINDGVMHLKEKDLAKLMDHPNVKNNLIAQETPCKANCFIIAVPTPLDEKKNADLSYVKTAVESITEYLEKGDLVIIESTVPPLTCRNIVKPIIEQKCEGVLIAHCPERILPGNIFHEIVYNDRIIGGITNEATKASKKLYSRFVKGDLYETDDITAELCKLVENTYRDVNIALSNELSLVAEKLEIDIKKVIRLANKHPRVSLLNPGIGVGGHCIPIDPWFISQVNIENSTMISTARTINDKMPQIIADKVKDRIKDIINPKIIVLGKSYKPDTSDSRESPALKIVDLLIKEGYDLENYDPFIDSYELRKIAKDADCIVVLVEHARIIKELEDELADSKSVINNKIIMRF